MKILSTDLAAPAQGRCWHNADGSLHSGNLVCCVRPMTMGTIASLRRYDAAARRGDPIA